jgi:hypothetical protein
LIRDLSNGRFGKYDKLDLGRRGAISKPTLNPAALQQKVG